MARAVADRPPVPHLVARAVRQGQRIRWRRRIQGTAALAAALALVTAAPLALAALTAHRPPAANGTGRPTAFVLVSSPRGTTAVVPITVASGRRGKPIEIEGDNVRFTASMALSPDRRTLYVLTTAGVTPVNVATRRAGRPIRLDCGKHCDGTGMLLAPDGATAYVVVVQGGTPIAPGTAQGVVPVSLRTRTAGPLIRVAEAGAMAITPDGRTLYVQRASISKTIEVTPIRTATDTALRPITIRFPGFTIPNGIVMAPVGHTLYLCNGWYPNSSQSGEMFVRVNTATNTASAPIEPKNFFGWCAAAFSADGTTVFMGGRTDVLAMDTATGALLAPIRMPSWMQVFGLTMSPDGRVLYAVFPFNPGPGIQPIDTATGALLRPIRIWVPRHFLPGQVIAIGPDGTAYATRFRSYGRTRRSELGQVIPVNLATGRIGTAISLGDAQADQVVFAP
jgi:sugar lactone lactonase YvrE